MLRSLFSRFEVDVLNSIAISSETESVSDLFSVIEANARTKTSKRNKKIHFLMVAGWLVSEGGER